MKEWMTFQNRPVRVMHLRDRQSYNSKRFNGLSEATQGASRSPEAGTKSSCSPAFDFSHQLWAIKQHFIFSVHI